MESPQRSLSQAIPTDFVQVGVVVGTHGYDGRLRIRRETDNPGRFRRGAELWIAGQAHRVQRTGGAGEVVLVKVAGIESREEAAVLVREPVLVPVSALPDLPQDTYYHYQLIGMPVSNESGEDLGTLTEIISTGANDVYVVTREGRELLVPAIADVVRDVDVAAARMTVALPDGLEWRDLKTKAAPSKAPRRRGRPGRKPPPASQKAESA